MFQDMFQDSILTRRTVESCFQRAWLSKQEQASNNIIELKLRAAVCTTIDRNNDIIKETLTLLEKQSYDIDDVITCIVEELFDDYSSWDFIVCLYAFLEMMTRYEFNKVCQRNVCFFMETYLNTDYVKNLSRYVDHAMRKWIADNRGWMGFCQEYNVNMKPWIQKRLFTKFYYLLLKNTYTLVV